ncbi:MAG: hypothetical protein RLZZ519_1457, partial [Bacteroidota bacterium]
VGCHRTIHETEFYSKAYLSGSIGHPNSLPVIWIRFHLCQIRLFSLKSSFLQPFQCSISCIVKTLKMLCCVRFWLFWTVGQIDVGLFGPFEIELVGCFEDLASDFGEFGEDVGQATRLSKNLQITKQFCSKSMVWLCKN